MSVDRVHIPSVDLGDKKNKCSVTDDLFLVMQTPIPCILEKSKKFECKLDSDLVIILLIFVLFG